MIFHRARITEARAVGHRIQSAGLLPDRLNTALHRFLVSDIHAQRGKGRALARMTIRAKDTITALLQMRGAGQPDAARRASDQDDSLLIDAHEFIQPKTKPAAR